MGRWALAFILVAGCIYHPDYPPQVAALTPSTSESPARPTHREPPSGSLDLKKGPFAQFFNQVKHQVREQWHPDVAFRQHDPNFSRYGRSTRLTIVQVQLTPRGELINVTVSSPSGVPFLDEEALAAFRNAQPFSNAPKNLADSHDGLIEFSFGFMFESASNANGTGGVPSPSGQSLGGTNAEAGGQFGQPSE